MAIDTSTTNYAKAQTTGNVSLTDGYYDPGKAKLGDVENKAFGNNTDVKLATMREFKEPTASTVYFLT